MNNNVMIDVHNISKEYRLGTIGSTTLREELQRKKAKLLRKEDPTKKIGTSEIDGELFKALDSVSFKVEKGERLGIIGHNGAGKTTILKLISRITAPTSGEIGLNGKVASMLEVGTGFHGELTGRENIYMNGAILGMTKKEIDEKINKIIDFSEVGKFIDTPVKRYSSGMFVKLAFSVAAHLDAEIVIMDEVLAVGDVSFQRKCIQKMKEIATKENRTILYVSHNMATIRDLCKRCIVLEKGRIVFDGDCESAIKKYLGNTDVSSKCIDLSIINRDAYKIDRNVLISKMEFVDNDYASFVFGQKINVRLHFITFKKLDNLFFRIPIFTIDKIRIGTVHTDLIHNVETGNNCIEFEIDLCSLFPGQYSLWLIARSDGLDEYSFDHDVVANAARFEIVRDDLQEEIIPGYNYDAWGPVNFPKANILLRRLNKDEIYHNTY